jgi:hypothetical protein
VTENGSTPAPDACEREIRSLHDFFVGWYTGRLDEGGFDRFEDALSPDFEMVTPDGEVLTRAETVGYVREERDTHDEFDIGIRNVETIDAHEGRALLRYEEWQTKGDENETQKDGRLSTALFGTSDTAPEGVEWLYLHETPLEG